MIIDWINDPTMTIKDKLIMILFELRAANKYQLARITWRSPRHIDKVIEQINRDALEKKGGSGPKKKWGHGMGIRSRRGNNKVPRMYSVGPVAWERVQGILGERIEYQEHTGAQDRHYEGLNEILVNLIEIKRKEQLERAIQEGYLRPDEIERLRPHQIEEILHQHGILLEGLEWYNTSEAAQDLVYVWEMGRWNEWQNDQKQRTQDVRRIVQPDAKVIVNGQLFWIEFDTGSERGKKITEKYRNYIWTFEPIPEETGLLAPVVWVTWERKRAETLQSEWEKVSLEPEFKDHPYIPDMHFFCLGEETTFLLGRKEKETVVAV